MISFCPVVPGAWGNSSKASLEESSDWDDEGGRTTLATLLHTRSSGGSSEEEESQEQPSSSPHDYKTVGPEDDEVHDDEIIQAVRNSLRLWQQGKLNKSQHHSSRNRSAVFSCAKEMVACDMCPFLLPWGCLYIRATYNLT